MKKLTSVFLLILLGGTVYAQDNQLQLVYESPEGWTIPVDGIFAGHYDGIIQDALRGAFNLNDADGDGVSDLLMRTEDGQGNLQDLLVVDGRTREVIWQVEDVQGWVGDVNLDGFADVLDTGTPQAIFSSREDVILINPSERSLEWSCGSTLIQMGADPNCVLVGILDLTGDNIPDLIAQSRTGISYPTLIRLRVWSIDR